VHGFAQLQFPIAPDTTRSSSNRPRRSIRAWCRNSAPVRRLARPGLLGSGGVVDSATGSRGDETWRARRQSAQTLELPGGGVIEFDR
jgi:hypothetical protein